jgi:hypothetical protein
MKYVRNLGLVVTAAMALLAVGAGNATATTLTSPAGTVYKGELVASVGGSLTFKEEGFGTWTCTAGVYKAMPNPQSESSTVTASISTLTLGPPRVAGGNEEESQCENGATTINVLKRGSVEIHLIGSGPSGTLTSSGTEVTTTRSGVHCIYTTNNTDLGTLTSGKTATIDIKASLNRAPTSFLCAEHAGWEGNYVVTTPDELFVS